MSDDQNKPKNISELGMSFEDLLAQNGKLSKQVRKSNSSAPSTKQLQVDNTYNSSSNSGQKNRITDKLNYSSSHRLTNPNSQRVLDEYREKGKSKQILKTWFMLMQAFDSKMKHWFGEEPDVHFMKFAAALTPESFKRLEANLLERLDEDKEWPPSLVRLRQLANSPTKETMYLARQHLFHRPVPKDDLDRVELFIKKYKMHEVRTFSEKNFEAEFNRKYTQWFREVLLDDMDQRFDQQQNDTVHYIEDSISVPTEHDKHRDELIASGKAFNNKFGQKILKAISEKSGHTEEISMEESVRIEQRLMAERIRKKTGDH